MEGLAKKIRGDWFDIREASDNQYELEEYFSLDHTRLQMLCGDLRMAVEQGVSEFKSHALSRLYSFLDSYRYDSRGFEGLGDQEKAFTDVLYVTLLQRLLAGGIIEIREPRQDDSSDAKERMPGVKDIIQDVQERIKEDPELKQDRSIKNILMQIHIYRTELERMKQLQPKILPDKKEAFLANFKKRFAEITLKIQEHYRVIMEAEERAAAEGMEEMNPLKRYDLKPLGKLLLDQAMELSAVRSTLLFAVAEGFKTREILSDMTDRRERTQLLIRMERNKYTELVGKAGDPDLLSKAFARELMVVLERQIARAAE